MALLDLAGFRAQYPEFDGAPDALVTTLLGYAAERTPEDIWGDLQEEGHGLLTAHLLSLRPEGRDMRLSRDGVESIYGHQRMHLNRIVASGFRVTGDS